MPNPDRDPDIVLLAGGSMVGLYVCPVCGAAVLQLARDLIDRPTQHAQWHRLSEPKESGRASLP